MTVERETRYTVRSVKVPLWSTVGPELTCSGDYRRPPIGTVCERMAGTVDRPLVRAWFDGAWWYGWLWGECLTVVGPAVECSVCRGRHGREVLHACE